MKKRLGFKCLLIASLISMSAYAKDVFVDAEKGKDTNRGTFKNPFMTIQKASDEMAEGDVCYIRAGVYRETLIPETDQLTFRNYENEYVLITGLDVVEGWTPFNEKVWKADFKRPVPNSFKASMVFVNGKRMNWARFPNEDGDMLNNTDMVKVTVGLNTNDSTNYLGTVEINDLPTTANNAWVGAYFIGVADEHNWFTANKGLVQESNGKSLIVKDMSWNWNRKGKSGYNPFHGEGFGYLIGCMQALDAEKEWHFQNDTLYFYPPANTDVNTALIEARSRILGVDLSGKTNINLDGINFKAAGLKMEDSKNCVINECTFRYASSFTAFHEHAWGDYKNGDAGIFISGDHNTVKDCYIGYTWGNGINMWGNHNILENSIVEHCNWQAERLANVSSPGDDNIIRGNTIRYGAREGIELGNSAWIEKYAKRALIQNNHVHHCGTLCPDGGLLYVNHQGADKPLANTDISYNIMHDYPSLDKPRTWGGIYIDNMSSGYNVHHNVIWNVKSGVHINDPSADINTHDVYIYNNTMINTEFAVRWWKGKLGSINTHTVVVQNNQSNGGEFMGTQVENNRMDLTDADFVDGANNNYHLKSTSGSINKGFVIPGINDDAVGLPDLGAYEFNGQDWRAGSTIKVPDFPDEK